MTDADVRRAIYELTIQTGSIPTADGVVWASGLPLERGRPGGPHHTAEVIAAFHRLAEQRILVLDGDTIRMAAPFSAVTTPFVVRTDSASYYANCIWDALGVSPMLKTDSVISTTCPDCDTPLELRVEGDEVIGEGLVHFSVAARQWWADIVFT